MIHTSSNQQWYWFGRKCWYQHGCHHNSVFVEEISIAFFFFFLFQKVCSWPTRSETVATALLYLLMSAYAACNLFPYSARPSQFTPVTSKCFSYRFTSTPRDISTEKNTLKTYIQSQGQLSMMQSCTCIPLPPALHKRNSTPYCRTYSTYFK